jgi:hypothetical protein
MLKESKLTFNILNSIKILCDLIRKSAIEAGKTYRKSRDEDIDKEPRLTALYTKTFTTNSLLER